MAKIENFSNQKTIIENPAANYTAKRTANLKVIALDVSVFDAFFTLFAGADHLSWNFNVCGATIRPLEARA